MSTRSVFLVILVAITVSGSVAAGEYISGVSFASHDIKLVLDVPSQMATITDRGEVEVKAGWNLFYLDAEARISSLTVDGEPADYDELLTADTVGMPLDIRPELPTLPTGGDLLLVMIESETTHVASFEIEFVAPFDDPVENVRFSRENVGNEVNGTIGEMGAYLSPSAHYYPMGGESLSRFKLTADVPVAWHSVADGNRVSSEIVGDRRVETFENPYTNDGCMFMAAPYVVKSLDQDGVEVACYFFEADTALIDGYLEATAGYIEMYSEMIGPYPFERFTVAENFFPTGYGMPAWTLLGQQVLRLPFIKATSLGHEVLHNWWGNSVYVDYERGNWCEAATVYGADYRYKLNESEAAAKAYRKDILKAYDSYVNEGNDFPIREFTSRASAGERTIGYSKAMMVYHMIEQEIGSEAFWAAWPMVFERYIGKKISWEEWIETFEETSGQDLSHVIPQWIDRAGAPMLSLGEIAVSDPRPLPEEPIQIELFQSDDNPYQLRVPIRTYYMDPTVSSFPAWPPGSELDTAVILDGAIGRYELVVPGWVSAVAVDPDYHLFRRLYPEEVEPIVSAVLGFEHKRFVTYISDEQFNMAFQLFGENIAEGDSEVESEDILNQEIKDFAPVVLNPIEFPDNLASSLVVNDSTVYLDGEVYTRAGHTFVMAVGDWNGFARGLVVLTDDAESLPRLGQLVPHYGKYSYLVFEGARNVGKGQWPVGSSPLRKAAPYPW